MKQVMKNTKKESVKESKTELSKEAALSIRPLGDRVLIKPVSQDNNAKSPSGIIIPETVSKEKPEQGRVLAVGEGWTTSDGKLVPLNVKVGDEVIFSKYGYDEVKIDGVEYFILKQENILAVIK
jgi:chaperonin GroES